MARRVNPHDIEIDAAPLPNKRIRDLRGQTFGRLTAVAYEGNSQHGRAMWRCSCTCGASITVLGGDLASDHTTSCGCHKREVAGMAAAKLNRTHGLANHPLYHTWTNMLARCYRPTNKAYARYGSRGITVHPDWRDDPAAFIAYVTQLPRCGEPDVELDRIDNDGNYEPGNVQWLTRTENSRKKGNNRLITYHGRAMCLAEWAEALGLVYDTLHARLNKHGWPVERALTEGVDPARLASVLAECGGAA